MQALGTKHTLLFPISTLCTPGKEAALLFVSYTELTNPINCIYLTKVINRFIGIFSIFSWMFQNPKATYSEKLISSTTRIRCTKFQEHNWDTQTTQEAISTPLAMSEERNVMERNPNHLWQSCFLVMFPNLFRVPKIWWDCLHPNICIFSSSEESTYFS